MSMTGQHKLSWLRDTIQRCISINSSL